MGSHPTTWFCQNSVTLLEHRSYVRIQGWGSSRTLLYVPRWHVSLASRGAAVCERDDVKVNNLVFRVASSFYHSLF